VRPPEASEEARKQLLLRAGQTAGMEKTGARLDGAAVRQASDSDLDVIVEQIWQVAAEGRWIGTEVPFDRAARRERLASALANESATILVAYTPGADGQVEVGHIWVSIAPYGVADIGMLVVEGWRGRGIGKLLLESAMRWAANTGAHKMALEVWPHNEAAIGLYRRAGFVEEGRKVRHYRRRNGELWDSVLMGRPLARPS
jgi:ribosomal protein S18 acetylase RimI-like enzyme